MKLIAKIGVVPGWLGAVIKAAPFVYKIYKGSKNLWSKWEDWCAERRKKKIDAIDDANDVTNHLK
ncbi:MAG: hypothetical protein IID18_00260 [Nitrospinae bacterium]|nr:hypothetical protein [Nitrospinota bacterium]